MQIDIALEPEFSASELAELGELAERHGIATIWVTNDPQARDLFMLYARVAEVTDRIRLGVMAVSPLEVHPIKLSASLQTLNEMSNGRASIVVGAGGAILAHTKLDLSRRVRAVRECIEILKDTNADKPLNFNGELYPAWNFQTRWAVDVPPRVLAGANGDQMLRMSARRADGVHMSDMPLPLVPDAVQKVTQALETHGRPVEGFEFNNFWAFHVKEDRTEAELEARSRLILRGMLKPMYISPFLNDADMQVVRENLQSFYKPFYEREAFCKSGGVFENVSESIVDTLVENLTLTATTAELDDRLEVLHEFASAGLTHITLGLHDNPADTIRLIGERVIPALR
ncbi:MAG: LLM class flavin-dependent oxidoreductase [Chromatiales bacterium]|nr:MAG: LLM class flavin-dependent oxidoreductase [Chromatiales bacterium]